MPQHVADLARQRFAAVWLAEQVDAIVQPPAMHDRVIGIARREENRDVRQPFPGSACQLRTVERPRHDHVGKYEIDRHAAFDDCKGALRILGAQYAITEFGEQIDDRSAHVFVVLDDKNGFRPPRDWPGLDLGLDIFGLARARQIEPHGRALPELAIDLDVSA